jgi:hypothetical protein
MTVEYEWGSGAQAHGVDAQIAGEAIERIQAKHGGQPEAIVTEARKKSSPLHPLFVWDDSEAAERWRVQQARQLVNHLVIKRVDQEDTPPVRAFVSVVTDQGREYMRAADAREDPVLREQIRQGLMAELARVRGKLAGWQEFSKAAELVGEAQERLREAA